MQRVGTAPATDRGEILECGLSRRNPEHPPDDCLNQQASWRQPGMNQSECNRNDQISRMDSLGRATARTRPGRRATGAPPTGEATRHGYLARGRRINPTTNAMVMAFSLTAR